jgi:DNA-binding NarL/FixJ family response regulator
MVLKRSQAILVWDEHGEVFRSIRRTKITVPLWRVTQMPADRDLDEVDLAIVALYRPTDWSTIKALVRKVPTVVVGHTEDRRDAGQALAAGAFGYLSLGLQARALRRAVLGALRGEPAYSRAVLGERVRAELSATAKRATKAFALTPRQREVVALIAKGASDKEIGLTLGIATATAQKHVTHVLKRMEVPNRAAAAVAATLWAG